MFGPTCPPRPAVLSLEFSWCSSAFCVVGIEERRKGFELDGGEGKRPKVVGELRVFAAGVVWSILPPYETPCRCHRIGPALSDDHY